MLRELLKMMMNELFYIYYMLFDNLVVLNENNLYYEYNAVNVFFVKN